MKDKEDKDEIYKEMIRRKLQKDEKMKIKWYGMN